MIHSDRLEWNMQLFLCYVNLFSNGTGGAKQKQPTPGQQSMRFSARKRIDSWTRQNSGKQPDHTRMAGGPVINRVESENNQTTAHRVGCV